MIARDLTLDRGRRRAVRVRIDTVDEVRGLAVYPKNKLGALTRGHLDHASVCNVNSRKVGLRWRAEPVEAVTACVGVRDAIDAELEVSGCWEW